MKRVWAVPVLLLLLAGLLVPSVVAQGPTPPEGRPPIEGPTPANSPPAGHGEWLSRGDPVSLPTNRGTTEVAQPGVYRYDSGQPDQVDILVCSDSCEVAPPNTCAEVALRNMGHSYTLYYQDWAGCEAALGSGAYDVALIDNSCFFPAESLFDALEAFLNDGGRAIINTFDMDAFPTNGLWATAGVEWVANVTTVPPVHRWIPNHPAVNSWPADPLLFDNLYIDDGDKFDPLPIAQALAGYTASPAPGEGAMAVRGDDKVVTAGFCIDNLAHRDENTNGIPDCVEVWQDAARFLLRPFDLRASFKWTPPHVMRGAPITYTVVLNTTSDEPPLYLMTDTLPVDTPYIPGSLSCTTGNCWYTAADNTVHWEGLSGLRATGEAGRGEWLSRGDPVSLPTNRGTTEVAQPGVYRYDSGQPEGVDILVCSDSCEAAPPNTCAEVALRNMGHSYTLYYQDWAGCEAALGSGAYDVALIDNSCFFPAESLFDALDAFLNDGGRAIINTFDMDAFPTNGLWATAGVEWVADITTAPSVRRWIPNHPAVNKWPADPLLFDNLYIDDGDFLNALPIAQALAGYSDLPHLNAGAMSVRLDDKVVVAGFCIDNLTNRDENANGIPDCVEVWQDGAGFLLQPRITFAVDSTYAQCLVTNRAILEDPISHMRVVVEARTNVWNMDYFRDDFEAGYGNWTMNGLWNPEDEGDACGSLVSPFPSSSSDAYYGLDGTCTYNNGAANAGELTMDLDVDLTDAPAAMLHFWSFEGTECGYGNACTWDQRYVDVSTDGGATWKPVPIWRSNGPEGAWYPAWANLDSYLGGTVRVRFRFDTLDNIQNDFFGWMVDDVAVVGCAPPEIAVDAPPLEAELCPSGTVATEISICDMGPAALEWNLLEVPRTFGLAGGDSAPVPAGSSDVAPEGYKPTLTRSSSRGSDAFGDTVCIFKDADAWLTTSVEDALAFYGIPYEVHTSAEFASLDFADYGMIVFSGDQPQAFYDAYAANAAKFEQYVTDGGILNFFSCDDGWNLGLLGAPLPGGVQWESGFYESYNLVVDPSHPVMAGIPNPFWGSYASHGHFSNLPANAEVLAQETIGGLPTIVAYTLGSGQVLALGQPLEYGYNNGQDTGLVMVNALLWGYGLPSSDVPWLDEDPLNGLVLPGECTTVTVSFDAAGMDSGVYTAGLFLTSNAQNAPTTTLPVTLTVLDPAHGADFDWTPVAPTAGLVVTFTGTANGTEPISYAWDLGDSTFASGPIVTHTYADAGVYTVVMTATNTCTADVVQHSLTVESGAHEVYLPLVFKNY